MEHYFDLAIKNIFTENILLGYFIGMCSFLVCSKQIKTAFGIGIAVIFMNTVTTPLNWVLKEYLLKKGALAWAGLPDIDLSFLIFIAFIATIAAFTQIVEMLVDRFSPTLYAALGIFLPLIAVNCAVLGASLFMDQREYNLPESIVYGFSSGAGWAVAIITLSALRYKMWYADVPVSMKGLGITMIVTGFMAMAFMAFAGLRF